VHTRPADRFAVSCWLVGPPLVDSRPRGSTVPEVSDDLPDNEIAIRFRFPSPDGVPEIATALTYAGFPEVKLYLVVEASATSADTDLQQLHDRLKDLGPMIEAADGGFISTVSRDGWTRGSNP
jgi:hypothetical protein